MRLLLDECVSPRVAEPLNAEGHVVTALRDVGGLGEPDYRVLRRCIDGDFDRQRTETLLRQAIDHLDRCGDPVDLMVNRVLEMTADGSLRLDDLPTGAAPGPAEP